MGSMPSLFGNQKLSRPPSPTGSIASISKKKSLFSKLKPSSSFHVQPGLPVERDASDSMSARNSVSLSGAPSPTLHGDGGITGGRRSVLEPLNERQQHGFDDEEHVDAIGGADIPVEPEDPQPVIKFQKRGGGVFTIGGGGGQKQRPGKIYSYSSFFQFHGFRVSASAFVRSDQATAILPDRFTAPAGQVTGTNSAISQTAAVSNLPKDGAVNAAVPKEVSDPSACRLATPTSDALHF